MNIEVAQIRDARLFLWSTFYRKKCPFISLADVAFNF